MSWVSLHDRWMWFACSVLWFSLSEVGQAMETSRADLDVLSTAAYFDRWMYPFNVTPGTRIQASVFGTFGSTMFDERDGQYLLVVDTQAAGIPTGWQPGEYRLHSARLRMIEATGGYHHDPTYDTWSSYLSSSQGHQATNDLDTGRPLELYGVGLRNGYETFGFPDGATKTTAPIFSAGNSFGPPGRATRPAFAADAAGVDVSNNVDSLHQGADGFDPVALSIARIEVGGVSLAAGDFVPEGAEIIFDFDLSHIPWVNYLQQSLSRGQLALAVSSLQVTGELGAGDPYPNLVTANHPILAAPVWELTWEHLTTSPVGDFDRDGAYTAHDIDLLTAALRRGDSATEWDVNGDRQVDHADRAVWVHEVASTYFGDSNLDRLFDSRDLVDVFQAGLYEISSGGQVTWSQGDWDGDGAFMAADFVIAFQDGGYERGSRVARAGEFVMVPETLGGAPWSACLVWLFAFTRWRAVQGGSSEASVCVASAKRSRRPWWLGRSAR